MRNCVLLLAVIVTAASHAADISVEVRDQAGKPVPDAVLSLAPQFELPSDMALSEKAEMRQRGTMFSPFVLPVHVGTTVTFPNFDEFRHQVYSFSKPKRFELRLYGQDESKIVTFDNPGVVALGCNIHDNMLAYIYVSEHPIFGKTASDGLAHFSGLPAGRYDFYAWHPDLKSGEAPMLGNVDISEETGNITIAVTLRSIRSVQNPPTEDEYS